MRVHDPDVASSAKDDWNNLWEIIANGVGIDFRYYRQTIVRRRVETWGRRHGYRSVREIADHLVHHPADAFELVAFVTVDVSDFYRNRMVFQFLVSRIRDLWRREVQFRAISLGCGRGQEAYSLAFILQSIRPEEGDFEIVGLDIDGKNLEYARRGRYPAAQIRSLEASEREQYGVMEAGDFWSVAPAIRRRVQFVQGDLFSLPVKASSVDLVLCRNVLIFIEPRYHDKVFTEVNRILHPGGYLVLGAVERVPPGWQSLYRPISVVHHVYQKGMDI